MSIVAFDQLPDTSRLWIFGSGKSLNDLEIQNLSEHMSRFMEQWTAHKMELRTGWELRHDQFILVGVDENVNDVSGCSIDSMVNSLRDFERVTGMDIINTSPKVFYRDPNQSIQCVDRMEFKQLIEKGLVNKDTIVFNNTIQKLAELRQGKWEVPMDQSWHVEAFGVLV